MAHQPVDPRLRQFARSMRRSMTEAEFRLWAQLRDRGLEGLKFRRQVPIGRFIADFLCAEQRLIVELDGGQHAVYGAAAADADRTAWLNDQGYRVLRFSNMDVLQNIDGVCAAILLAVRPPRP